MSSIENIIFQIRHVATSKIYEIDNIQGGYDLAKLKSAIRSLLSLDCEIVLCWSRASSPDDFISIVDDSNLKRCIDSQVNAQRSSSPSEFIVNIRITEEPIKPHQSIASSNIQTGIQVMNVAPQREVNLSKSTQIQVRSQKPAESEAIANVASPNNNGLLAGQASATYDRSKYTDFSCYNCGGGENGPIDPGCPVCLGVGKLLKSKEIDAIEYLVEKKLCTLFPELKTIYKRFQQQQPSTTVSNKQHPVQPPQLIVQAPVQAIAPVNAEVAVPINPVVQEQKEPENNKQSESQIKEQPSSINIESKKIKQNYHQKFQSLFSAQKQPSNQELTPKDTNTSESNTKS